MADTAPPDGFTPVPDQLVKQYGIIVAAVWGRMWRYAQMQDGVCRASFQTLADDLNLGRATVIRAVCRLEADGLLLDTTPDKIKAAHHYRVSSITATLDNEEGPEAKLVSQRSQTSITADKSSIRVIHKDSTKTRKILPNGVTPKPKKEPKEKEPPDPRTKAVVIGFQELVGYKLRNWPMESAAAKDMLKDGIEAKDMYDCWRYLQTDPFWNGKHCSLKSVANNIGPWIVAGRPANRQSGGTNGQNRRASWAQPTGGTNDDFAAECARRAAEGG